MKRGKEMRYNYKLKFYLSGIHYIMVNQKTQDIHPHTWEIVVYIRNINEEIILFGEVEYIIKDYLSNFEGKTLNEIDKFKGENFSDGVYKSFSTEFMAKIIFKDLIEILKRKSMLLFKIEVSERPTRTFVIES